MNLKEYYAKKGISEENLLKMFLKEKSKKGLPLNNRAINGYNIKEELTKKISITNPKFWPERGFYEY